MIHIIKLWDNYKFRSLIYSVITVIIELIIVCIFSGIEYLTSDDYHIQAVLNGTWTGNVYPFHQFINVVLGYFICILYSLFPYIQWWFVWSMFCMIIGLIMLHFSIFYILENKIIALSIIVYLAAAFELYCISQLSFLIVPVFFSLGALSLLLLNKTNTQLHWNSFLVTYVSIVLIISFLHREESALLMFAFYTLSMAIYTLKVHNTLSLKSFGKYIVTIGLTLLIMLSLSKTSSIIKADINGELYQEYNTNRINFMDYPKPSYEEASMIYEKNGWDENSYQLITNWCFMIDEYNLETLSSINEELGLHGFSIAHIFNQNLDDNFNKILNFLLITDVNYSTFLRFSLFVTLILYIIYGFFVFVIKRKPLNQNYIHGILSLCGGIFILFILVLCGRIQQRVLIGVAFPAITIAIIMLFQHNHVYKTHKKAIPQTIVFICGIVFLCGCIKYVLPHPNDNYETLHMYCNTHKQDVFIAATSDSIMTSLDTEFPPNLIFWGDSTSYSDLYYKRLQRLGLNELDLETLNNENVYFISTEPESEHPQIMLSVIKKHYSNGNLELVDQIHDELWVYKFSW